MAKKKRTRADEIAELENAFQNMTGSRKSDRKKSGFGFVLFVITLFVVAGFMVFCFLGDTILGRLGDVTIAGVDVSGMTGSEAKEVLTAATSDTYTRMDMVILVSGTELRLSPMDTGVNLDIDAAVNAARKCKDSQFDVLPYLNLDMTVIEDALSQLDAEFNASVEKTTCTVNGELPSLEPGAEGECQTLVITMGSPQRGLDIEALREDILNAYRGNLFRVRRDCTTLEPEIPDLDALYTRCCIPAVDAVMDMETFEITPETYGYDFDLEDAKKQAAGLSYGETVTITFRRTAPKVTGEELASLLYRDILASYKTEHTWDENRNTNLRLACEAINGLILFPGEQFAYNDTLGERTKEKGYKPAGAYVNGETVNTVGGGICQVSSTLYYCTLIADLQIDRRYPHSYVSSYMPMGMDATVSWGGPDFLFTNNTNYPIRIEASVSGGYVHVSIIGTDEKDYYVKMEYEILDTTGYDTIYQEMEPDNEKGLLDGDVITTPYTGYKVKTYKCRYSKETDKLISRDFEADSNYKKRDKVICKIADPNAPTETTEPIENTTPTETTGTTEPSQDSGQPAA